MIRNCVSRQGQRLVQNLLKRTFITSRRPAVQTILLQNSPRLLGGDKTVSLSQTRYQSEQVAQDSASTSLKGSRAETAYLDSSERRLTVTFKDGEVCQYPYIWLRDNCQCEKCFHPTTKSRLVLMKDLDLNSKPVSVELGDGGQNIHLTWADGHKTPLHSDWLQERAFTDRARSKRNEAYGKRHIKWGAEIKDKLQYFDYNKIMTQDKVLLDWLTQMETYGISLLTNAMNEDDLEKLAARVGSIRRTNYGDFFEVMTKENPSNLAYTSAALGLHGDLPFYEAIPGIQLLHFIHAADKGGKNQFADASHAADQLKKVRPDLYELLSTTLIDYYDIGSDFIKFHMIHQHPLIRHNYRGDVTGIAFNNQVRDTFLNVPIEKVHLVYEGYMMMNNIMYDPKNMLEIAMKSGHVVVFDNTRIMHGRTSYDGGRRHLVGFYMDWCDVRSKIRLLKADSEQNK